MTHSTARSPQEFGNSLRELRLAADVSLETITDRTKIGRRMLELIEEGQFEKLPDRVFVRMFVQQYVDIVGGKREEWLATFDGAWNRYLRGSQQFVLPTRPEVRTRRGLGSWIVGILLVTIALTIVFVLQRRTTEDDSSVDLPSAGEVATAIAPTPSQPATIPTATVVPTEAAAFAEGLVFETGDGECWIQVALVGGSTLSQLVPPNSRWEVATGDAEAEITIGSADAVRVTYRGQPVELQGRPGSVVHLRVPPP